MRRRDQSNWISSRDDRTFAKGQSQYFGEGCHYQGGVSRYIIVVVFFHELSEIRDGSVESQAFRASGLNPVVSAIILWNTAYLSQVVESLRAEGHDLPDGIIRHISPRIWEHINLTGIYDWNGACRPDGAFRPLRRATSEKMVEAA